MQNLLYLYLWNVYNWIEMALRRKKEDDGFAQYTLNLIKANIKNFAFWSNYLINFNLEHTIL